MRLNQKKSYEPNSARRDRRAFSVNGRRRLVILIAGDGTDAALMDVNE